MAAGMKTPNDRSSNTLNTFMFGAFASAIIQLMGFAVSAWLKPLSFVMLWILYLFCPPTLLGVFVDPGETGSMIVFRLIIIPLNGLLYVAFKPECAHARKTYYLSR